MNIPTIVTAFFDIGRSNWNGPSYLKRTTNQYFKCFERLLKLDNQIIVFTSTDLLDRFRHYKEKKENLIVVGLDNWTLIWKEFRPKIQAVFNNPNFQKMLHAPWNPECWSVDYVMVNFLKSWFVCEAIDRFHIESELIFWIDFGYAREDKDVPIHIWNCDFDPSKINMFTIKPNIASSMNIYEVIAINDVLITGCHIGAGVNEWFLLASLMYENIDRLLSVNVIDDDQSLLFMSYLQNPEDFVIRKISPDDWFCIFRSYNAN